MLRCAWLVAIGLIVNAVPLAAQTAPKDLPPTGGPLSTEAPPATEAPNSPESMEDTQPGDHWTYELRDDITGELKSTLTNTVTDVSGTEISIRVGKLGNANFGYLTYDRSWDLINSGVWRYTPNDGTGIRTPLAVGKTWSLHSNDLNSTAGVSWKRSGTAKVLAQESVTTRAGTFDTFKIEATVRLENANDPTKKAQLTMQTWYAPAINHWAKRASVTRSEGRIRDKTVIELVEYGRRE